MNILFKNKIAFKNGKKLAIHLNQIEKYFIMVGTKKNSK